jgi:vacuolar-type H+-ATPase subunit I/STV1
MKKTINVAIGGCSFTIDEDDYQTLDQYLEDFKAALDSSISSSDVMDELEGRIADLLKRVEALEGKAGETEEALRKMSAAKPAHEEVKSNEAKQSFRNAHQEMLYNLNKAR